MSGRSRSAVVWTVVFCIILVVVAVVGFVSWDTRVLDAVRDNFAREWRGTAKFFSRYGDFPWLLGGGLVALAVFLRMRRREWARIVVAMLLSGIVAGCATNAIKLGAGRVRPHVEDVPHGWYGPVHEGVWVAALRHDFQSFPSSHTACAVGFFFPLFLSRRFLGAVGLLAAAAIAWSRLQLSMHHVSDVAAGAVIGILAGWLVWRWIVARGGLARWLGGAEPGAECFL